MPGPISVLTALKLKGSYPISAIACERIGEGCIVIFVDRLYVEIPHDLFWGCFQDLDSWQELQTFLATWSPVTEQIQIDWEQQCYEAHRTHTCRPPHKVQQ